MHQTLYRISLGLLVFVTLLCPLLSFAAPTASGDPKRQYVSNKYFLILDTVKSGYLKSADGGVVSAIATNEPGGQSYFSKKHPSSIIYEPFTALIGFSMQKAVYQWISDSWSGKSTSHSGDVILLDSNYNSREQTKFSNALITETTIPACEGGNTEPGYLAVTFAPETALPVVPESVKAWISANTLSNQKAWMPSNFTLTINGLDCTDVSKIDSFTVKQTESGKVEFPNLKITLSVRDEQSWKDWHKDFIINGNNGDSKEKNGTLIFLAPNKLELARIEFFNLGILSIRPSATKDSDQIKRVTAELYCERMVFKGPGYSATHDTVSQNEPAKVETQDSQDAREPTDDCQLGQAYVIGNANPLNLTVNSLEYISSRIKTGTCYTRPGVGEKLLVVHYTLQNPAKTDFHVGGVSIDWMATDSNGVSRQQAFVSVEGTGNVLDQMLSAGKSVNCYAVISMPAKGTATGLAAPAHNETVNVARYKLKGKVTALPAPFADVRDSTGSTPLTVIPGKVGVSYPVGDYDVTVESVEFSDKPIPDMELLENYIYTIASLRYTSFTEGASEILGNDTELKDVDGQGYYSKSMFAPSSLRPITLRPEPGETVTFKLAFPTPKNADIKSLTLKSGLEYSVVVDISNYKTP